MDVKKFFVKILMTIVLSLLCMIYMKKNPSFKKWFDQNVYQKNINFSYVNKIYTKYFGTSFPFDIQNKTKTVFEEKLSYENASLYLDGVKLTVKDHYLVPILDTGMVIFIGEKEGYGKTIIMQQSNGIEVWYGNIQNTSLTIYDLKEKGEYLGEASKELYLVFKKNGKVLDYKEYI